MGQICSHKPAYEPLKEVFLNRRDLDREAYVAPTSLRIGPLVFKWSDCRVFGCDSGLSGGFGVGANNP